MDFNVLIINSFLIAVLAGTIGSFLGLGGGFIVVPGLTLLLGIPIHLAIGVSFIGILTNSASASVVYLRDGLTNIRIGTLLEVGALSGAIFGASYALSIDPNTLSIVFGIALLYGGFSMLRGRKVSQTTDTVGQVPHEGSFSYLDRASKTTVVYAPRHLRRGIGLSVIGGTFAGLLGVGGGSVLVPILNRVMGVPIKVAVATSSYVIGVTASAGALIFLSQGSIIIMIAVPTALGVLVGAQLGSRLVKYLQGGYIKVIFVIALTYISIQMISKGLGLDLPF